MSLTELYTESYLQDFGSHSEQRLVILNFVPYKNSIGDKEDCFLLGWVIRSPNYIVYWECIFKFSDKETVSVLSGDGKELI